MIKPSLFSLTLTLLTSLLTLPNTHASQSPLTLSCTSLNLTSSSSTTSITFETFLNNLLTTLDTAGYTSFEGLIAGVASGGDVIADTDGSTSTAGGEGDDTGLIVLEGMWDAVVNGGEEWVVLVPSDEAFSSSSLATPYTSLPITTSYPLLAYHILPSSSLLTLTLPASPAHTLVHTLLPIDEDEIDVLGAYDGSTTEGTTNEEDGSPLIVQKGSSSGQVVFKLTKGNATTVDGLTTLALGTGVAAGGLGGLKLVGIDGVLTPPTSLSDTLTNLAKSTTSATSSGLALYTAALSNTSTLSVLEAFLSNTTSSTTTKRNNDRNGFGLVERAATSGDGLTVFAPVDAAFDDQLTSGSVQAWAKVLNGHYSSAQTLFSTNFTAATAGSPITLYMASGYPLSVYTNSSGTFVLAGDGSGSVGKVLRTDVVLEGGGVLHVVDTLLSSSSLKSTSSKSASSTTSGADKLHALSLRMALMTLLGAAGLSVAIGLL